MERKSPIGFFDSGYGGLTVLRDVRKLLPEYDYLYLGDNARAPYGTKSQEVVYRYTWQCIQVLFEKGCELVILACNTASAKALRRIQQNDLKDFPGKRVLGVIRPSAEVVGKFSKTNEIVVLGTEGTIASNTYVVEFAEHHPEVKVHQYACPLWVPIVENREYETKEGLEIIKRDILRVRSMFKEADVYLLGCTHYPILKPFLETIIPNEIQIISQGEIVAKALKDYLDRHPEMETRLEKNRNALYFTTGDATQFELHAKNIIDGVEKVEEITV